MDDLNPEMQPQLSAWEKEAERNYKEWCRITGKDWTPHIPGTFPRGMGLVKTYTSESTEP